MFTKVGGEPKHLRRAVDADGNVLDILVRSRRDKTAARWPSPPRPAPGRATWHCSAPARHLEAASDTWLTEPRVAVVAEGRPLADRAKVSLAGEPVATGPVAGGQERASWAGGGLEDRPGREGPAGRDSLMILAPVGFGQAIAFVPRSVPPRTRTGGIACCACGAGLLPGSRSRRGTGPALPSRRPARPAGVGGPGDGGRPARQPADRGTGGCRARRRPGGRRWGPRGRAKGVPDGRAPAGR
ncbi:hypothetical protein GCM10010421_22990 [Streptomyces glaucus]|uniref:Uncharacterized protein n=1 Tax=Streptomyces glaucus TaxID=284029 RepID=A0ABN3JLQ9_9ACTN